MTMEGVGAVGHGHPPLRRWDGPSPTGSQRLLLAACLESEDVARDAWLQWLAHSDFDREDSASVELAGMAVARLGSAAGDGDVAVRCRGWNRRAWYICELVVDVAERLTQEAGRRGVKAVALGDLATLWAGYRFAGRPFDARRVELEFPGIHRTDLQAFRQVSLPEPAAHAVASGRVPLAIRARTTWWATPYREAADGKLIPDAATHIAWLASTNWQRTPPGRLRWIVEVVAALQSEPDAYALGPAIAAAAAREGTTAEVAAALRLVGSVPGGRAAGRIAPIVEATAVPPLSRTRRWARQRYRALRS